MMKGRLLYLLLLLLATGACFNLNRLSLYDLSGLYSNTLFTNPEAVAYHAGPNQTEVYVLLRMQDLSAEEDENTGRSYSKAKLSYQLFQHYESKDILDSASLFITDSSMRLTDTIIMLNVAFSGQGEYMLKLELTDMHRADVVRKFVSIDNRPSGRNRYMLINADGEPLFDPILEADVSFRIKVAGKDKGRLSVRQYKRNFPLAVPPFMEDDEYSFDYSEDSVFTVDLQGGMTEVLELPDEGFYHFQADTGTREGFTVYRFYDGFPAIITADQMLQPLRYITTRSEYDALSEARDVKLAVDNFWLNNAGNPTRARAMIQKFYGRVVDANNYFNSYHEGWKTDRGLIYIVYGQPQTVYRGKGMEEWLYGEKGNPNSIRFTFVKMDDPFTSNDYRLVKSVTYKEKWYNIVNTWRR